MRRNLRLKNFPKKISKSFRIQLFRDVFHAKAIEVDNLYFQSLFKEIYFLRKNGNRELIITTSRKYIIKKLVMAGFNLEIEWTEKKYKIRIFFPKIRNKKVK